MIDDKKKNPVLVTTKHRGVFFGYLVDDESPAELTLADARNCIYWDQGVNGFLGLAATGPSSKCKIGPTVPALQLFDITSITACTEAAEAAWLKA